MRDHALRLRGASARSDAAVTFELDRETGPTSLADRIAAGSASPIVITDGAQRIVVMNQAAEELFGRRSGDAEGSQCYDLLCGQDPFGNRFCHEHCIVGRMARSGEAIRYFELGIQGTGGKPLAAGVDIITFSEPDTGELRIVHILRALPEGTVLGASAQAHGNNGNHDGSGAHDGDRNGNGGRPGLTHRESEVLRFLASGKSCQEIASCLSISLLTARNHIRNILRKLDVHSQLEAVVLAHRDGIA